MAFSETKIFDPIDRHLTEPYFGLKLHNPKTLTYSASVRPLRFDELKTLGNPKLTLSGLVIYEGEIRKSNRQLLDSSDTTTVVLDARTNVYNQGFLGDMIEASRLVTVLRETGKNVRIVGSHTDIFTGTNDPGIEVIPIPADLPPATEKHWQPELLRYIGESAKGSPVLFPINARLPLLLGINPQGDITNQETVSKFQGFLKQTSPPPDIKPERWMHRGVHQLQALQITAHLIGLNDVYKWSKFPDAFLYPTESAQKSAEKIVNIYRCFFNGSNHDGIPYLIHPGVATNGRKVDQKAYPETRWRRIIEGMTDKDLSLKSLSFLKPVDPAQGAMATRLAEYAKNLGIKTALLPEQELRSKYGWTLGSFIAFLKELSHRKGVILGCDSMPAGHAAPALDIPSIVLGSPSYNPGFYCPPKEALVVMPNTLEGMAYTKDINPLHVIESLRDMASYVNTGTLPSHIN